MESASRQRMRLACGAELSFVTAGNPSRPTVLLLHGFPNSSVMFDEIVDGLADVAHIVAPDLPGFGESDVLPVTSFPAMGEAVAELVDRLSVGPRYIYLHDFGAPVGLHVAMRSPSDVLGLIIQNANAHRTGLGPQWAATEAFWADPSPRNEAAATAHLTLDGTRDQYVAGVPEDIAASISADRWAEDWRVMNLPGRMEAQRALIADYGNHVARFGEIGDYLRHWQPRALLLWGRHDVFFDLAEVASWMEDLPRMEAHVLDAGHLMLETHSAAALPLISAFIRASRTEPDAARLHPDAGGLGDPLRGSG